ncbi:extracellular solute-binding protein [Angustibacter luteus]|uniref:Extracellular solute-binding protein n=1 Tax=Angustibacter luteus TaxID=658456 RepID=A0ABW1JHU5_9ACTN
MGVRRLRGRLDGSAGRAGPPTVVLVATALLAGLGLAACGSGSGSGSNALTWYINPDNGSQAKLAAECTAQSNGAYKITTSILPNDASTQREQLLRRLAADDSSTDLMSLDPVFVAEFAQAGFLQQVPEDLKADFTADTVQPAIDASTWKDKLYAAPFWANTQLLWYRKSVAEKAGLDMSKPVTWAQIIAAAKAESKTVGVQANRYEGYTVWINALYAGAGGSMVENPTAKAEQIKLGIAGPAGTAAATVISGLAKSGVGGPSLSTEDEEAARALFQGDTGGFMVNWPYVWSAANEQAKDVVPDIGWTRYPRTEADKTSRPPFGGIELAVGAASKHKDLAFEAAKCITSTKSQIEYMVNSGNPAARNAAYDDAAVRKAFPMADQIRASLATAAPRPITAYYGDVSLAVQDGFHPPSKVDPRTTPEDTQKYLLEVLKGDALL